MQQMVREQNDLGNDPLGKLMVRLALPSIAAQLINLLYNLIDRIFLGHVQGMGADALTGLGVCMPIIVLVTSFTMLAAAGGAPLASMELGRGDARKARTVVLHIETLLFVFAVALMLICYAFMPQLIALFGASDVTAPYASSYLSVYLLGTPFVMVASGIGMLLLAQGDAKAMFVAQATGAIVHIVLAAVFIFVFGWGIVGAAVASVVSQGLSAGIVVFCLTRPSSALRFEFKLVRLEQNLVRRILSVGSGRFFIVASESLLLIVANSTLQAHGGDAYVGAMTVLFGIQSIVYAPIQGFTQGVQPIVSYCYGAGNVARVRAAIKRIVIVTFLGAFVITGVVMLLPDQCAGVFTDDAALASLAAQNVRVFFVGMLAFGIQLGMQTVFMGLGRGLCSLTVAAVRKVVTFIPLILVLSQVYGPFGVILAEPISDLVSVAFCIVLFLATIPRMLRRAENEAA